MRPADRPSRLETMTAQYGPHRFSAGEYDEGHTGRFRAADFTVRDLSGARIVDSDLTGMVIIDSTLVNVRMSGWVDNFEVNGVDVTEFVAAELDRRHPERVQLRAMGGPEDFRAMWDTIQRLWSDAVTRIEGLSAAAQQERIEDEWSFLETLRHLIFITDSWASRTVLDEPMPFHRLGLPQTWYPQADAAALGIDLDARPSWGEVLRVRADRMAVVRGLVDGLTGPELGRICGRLPAPGYPREERAVAECLAVVMEEEIEHYRYAMRDLAVLESPRART